MFENGLLPGEGGHEAAVEELEREEEEGSVQRFDHRVGQHGLASLPQEDGQDQSTQVK